MSLKLFGIQFGQSGTATNNITAAVPSPGDGTWKLARGNFGATTQDIITVDATNAVTVETTPASTDNSKKIVNSAWAKLGFVVLKVSNGYIKFPDWLGGIVIQWGTGSGGTAGYATINYPIVFPNAVVGVYPTLIASGPSAFATSVYTNNQTYFTVQKKYQSGATTGDAGESCSWIAIGY